ncbi:MULTISPECIES: IS256 family transposase [Micromonospora]|uniref:IS256 family transposase n=1 Tax=Micromonospora TaxID=1873 RepID=UPI000A9D764D|nr:MULTISPECIES: IS256 family transposase [Micromonospora]
MADKKKAVQLPEPTAAEVEFAQQLVERAKADGVSLVGPGGLPAGITRTVLESALDAELDAHLDDAGVDEESGRRSNIRNGHGAKTVQTEVGPVRIQVPRDRAGSFTPRIVPKHVRGLDGFNEAILSLYAKGLTTGEISAHLADVYDADVSRELISRVTDSVLEEMEAWRQRPLDRVYPVVFIDALVMKIREGQVANRPVYVVVGISLDGERDVLGMWAGIGGEGAKQWVGYLTELRNRGVADVLGRGRPDRDPDQAADGGVNDAVQPEIGDAPIAGVPLPHAAVMAEDRSQGVDRRLPQIRPGPAGSDNERELQRDAIARQRAGSHDLITNLLLVHPRAVVVTSNT